MAAETPRSEEIGLHNLKPKPGSRTAAQADRPRRGLGPRQDLRPRPQGRRLALGRQAQGRLRGRPEPDPHADAKAARPAQEEVDAVRELPHHDPAGQPRRPRGALRGRRRGDPRDAARRRAWRSARDPVKILARGEISKKLTVQAHAFSAAAKEKIEAAGGSCHTLEPLMLRTIANAFSVPEIRKKLAFTAAMLALYRLGAYIPVAGRRRRRRQGHRRTTSAAPTSSASSTSSPAAASRASRSSRWGSCPTSRPRSSCSC